MGTLFKNGTIITASDMIQADVLVEGEKVALIGQNIPAKGHEVVNCKGKYLLPGGIDVHTHLDLPFGGTYSNDDFDVGHKAAAFGGTTMHIDFAFQPKGGSLHDGLKIWREKAKPAQIDYGFHMAITDLSDEVMDEIPSMVEEGITSLKLFMAYKNVFQIDDTTLYKAMQQAAKHGMIVMVHAENGDVEAQLTPASAGGGQDRPDLALFLPPAGDRGRGDQPRGGNVRHDRMPAVCCPCHLRTVGERHPAGAGDRVACDG